MIYVFFQSVTKAYSEKMKIRVHPIGVDITSSDALPQSYGRLMGAKAIKLERELGFSFPGYAFVTD